MNTVQNAFGGVHVEPWEDQAPRKQIRELFENL